MQINWKLRLQNKATLITLVTTVVTAVYAILAAFGVTPSVTQDQVMNLVVAIVAVLAAAGIIVDPTTKGMSDSDRAMMYDEPKDSE